MKVEIYSDIACPWCYVGKARFERALAESSMKDDVEVVFRPYQLDPDAPREAVPMWEYLETRFGPNVRGMVDRVFDQARAEGLPMDYDRGLAVNTLNAHRLLRLAEQEYGADAQRSIAAALFRAHFAEGKDVSDPETLAEIGATSGMDAERTSEYLRGNAGAAEVEAQIDEARQIGVTAVPTFVFDEKYAVQGAQPLEIFQRALSEFAD
jgi:predicted DsbA family dithiol-disulfide isomerase